MRTALLAALLLVPVLVPAQDQVARDYYPDGTLRSIHITTDDRTSYTAYHENGRVRERGTFLQGKPDGRWTQFDADGTWLCKVKFDQGVRTGVWHIRTADRSSTHRLVYRGNDLIRGEQFDTDGTLVTTSEGH